MEQGGVGRVPLKKKWDLTEAIWHLLCPSHAPPLELGDGVGGFHKGRFQNERFARGCFKNSQKNFPKRAFRAKLPTFSQKKVPKWSFRGEAASKFHRKSFQNERFVRSFLQFSQKKVPKWSFRAKLPAIFTEKTSKTSVSCEASDNFHRKNIQKDRFARCFRQFSQKKLPKGPQA